MTDCNTCGKQLSKTQKRFCCMDCKLKMQHLEQTPFNARLFWAYAREDITQRLKEMMR